MVPKISLACATSACVPFVQRIDVRRCFCPRGPGRAPPPAAFCSLQAACSVLPACCKERRYGGVRCGCLRSESHCARRAKHHHASRLECRRANDAAHGLAGQPGDPQADRGGQRLDQGDRRDGANQATRSCPGGLNVYVQGSGLQPGPPAAVACDRMTLSASCPRARSAAFGRREDA